MLTREFDYDLPPGLIAQQPAARRDESRMMVVHRTDGRLEHRRFGDFPAYTRTGDVVVVNETRVIPARIFGRKQGSGGRVELLMLEEVEPGVWDVLLRARRRPAPGARIILAEGRAGAVMLAEGELGRARVRVESAEPFMAILDAAGVPPLPPYIARKAPAAASLNGAGETGAMDRERYQTIYARAPGAVAAPTAGLHFTPEVFQALEKRGVRRSNITLHVGIGTFRPVSAERVADHRMDAERYCVPEESARTINAAREAGGRIIAVGTTTVRTLETVVDAAGRIAPGAGRTSIFIYPPHQFRAVDALLTNFHLPKSTLLMMICAFAGRELVFKAYAEAIRQQYRFYSYGDCMLIV